VIQRLTYGVLLVFVTLPAVAAIHDILIRGGTVFDGSLNPPVVADVAIDGDRITAIGDLADRQASRIIDASGLAVAPGFINMLSWASESLLLDGRSQSNIRQGVTLEIFGEGSSMGPLNARMKDELIRRVDGQYDVAWTSLGEYLEHLEREGVAPNVASFVGATTVRIHELGYANRAPTRAELNNMKWLVRQAMLDGALGLGSSLIYAPAFYAQTEELVALAQTVADYRGTYISHMRSEGNRLLESIDELIQIARQTGVNAEIYHFKVSGAENWHKFDTAIETIEAARAAGLAVSANMYTYTAGSTGLDAAMPPWVQEGGYSAWRGRLSDPDTRAEVIRTMQTPGDEWENLLLLAGADKTLLVGFKNPQLRKFTGHTLAEVAAMRGQSPAATAIDLVIEDGSRVQVVYFLMSEENVARAVALPWMSFGSDAGSIAAEGSFLETSTHPRTYGNFARLLGKYVRDEQRLTLTEAIHKLTSSPARNLRIPYRGEIKPNYFADLAIFDPATITDHATYEQPHQYATGMHHVLVNGELVLLNGEHTHLTPGRVVRGPGWRGWRAIE
jgi:N-acyl-D-amino-acid deacylase